MNEAENYDGSTGMGMGLFSERPASPALLNTAYFATDKGNGGMLYVWDGDSWNERWTAYGNYDEASGRYVHPLILAVSTPNTAPVITELNHNAADSDLSKQGLQIYTGRTVTYSASVFDIDRDDLTYTWSYKMNGGSETACTPAVCGSDSTKAVYNYTTPGIYEWTLRVSDGTTVSTPKTHIVEVLPIIDSGPGTRELNITQVPYNASGITVSTTGSMNEGTNQITLEDASSFSVGQGIFIEGAGKKETAVLLINQSVQEDGVLTITLNGVSKTFEVSKGQTGLAVVKKIRSYTFDGWILGGGSDTVTFISTTNGDKINAVFSEEPPSTGGVMTTTTEGTDDLIARIISMNGNTLILDDSAGLNVTNVLAEHDDSIAIQSAINDAREGDTVYGPEGHYLLHRPLIHKANVFLDIPEGSLILRTPQQAPSISIIPAHAMNKNTTATLAFNINDQETAAEDLVLSVSSANQGLIANGNIILGGSGANRTVTFTPTLNQGGFSDITITVTDSDNKMTTRTFRVTVDAGNTAPVWTVINPITMNENVQQVITLQASDVDGNTLTYSGINLPEFASISGNQLTIFPNFNHSGSYNLTLRVSDGTNAVNQAVSLTIQNVNRVPVLDNLPNQNVRENELINVTLPGSDPDGDALTYTVTGLPQGATLVGNIFRWTPGVNQSGNYGVTFTVSDGNLSVTKSMSIVVGNSNRAPVFNRYQEVVSNEDASIEIDLTGTDPDGDVLTLDVSLATAQGGILVRDLVNPMKFLYIPKTNYSGPDHIRYTMSDGEYTIEGIVAIRVNPVNDAPTANAVSIFGDEDREMFAVLKGSDIDFDELTYVIDQMPEHGRLECNGRSCQYIPDADYEGNDSFIYHVSDGKLDSNQITVPIRVNGMNDVPVIEGVKINGELLTESGVAISHEGEVRLEVVARDVDNEKLSYRVDLFDRGVDYELNEETGDFILRGIIHEGSLEMRFHVTDGKLEAAVITVRMEMRKIFNQDETFSFQAILRDVTQLVRKAASEMGIKKANTVVLKTSTFVEVKKEAAADLYTPSTIRKDSLERNFFRNYDLFSSSRTKDYEKFWEEYLSDLKEDEKSKYLETSLLKKSEPNVLNQSILAAPTGIGTKMGEHLEDFLPNQDYLSTLEGQVEPVKEPFAQDAFIDPAQLKAVVQAHQNTHAKNQKIKVILDKQKKKS